VTTLPETDEASLACYKIAPGSQPPVQHIDFDNQIGAPDTMRIGPSGFVCVPSTILTDPHGNDARRSPSVELQAKPQGRN